MRCNVPERAWFWRDNAIFGRRTVPGMCEPDLSIDNDNGFRSIFGAGPALKRSRDTSGNGGGLPEGGPGSALDRAGWSGLAGFYRRAAADCHVRGPQNGLAGWAGLAGWLGWLAGLQAVSNSVPESSVPFGRDPPAVGRSQ